MKPAQALVSIFGTIRLLRRIQQHGIREIVRDSLGFSMFSRPGGEFNIRIRVRGGLGLFFGFSTQNHAES